MKTEASIEAEIAPRLERSSFYGEETRNKKAGVEGGLWRPKK